MQKIVFLLFVLVSSSVFAQTDIDKVNSDSAAMDLFKKHIIRGNAKSNFNDFKLVSGTEWVDFYNFNDNQKNQLLSKYKYLKWAKIDLNKDKKEDLILSGYLSKTVGYSNHYRTFIFLTNPDNTIQPLKFNSNVPFYFRLIEMDTATYIETSRWTNDLYKKVEDIPLRIDTVTFQPALQALIDYERQVPVSSIKKVTYKETYDPQNFLVATVTNNGARNGDFSISLTQQKEPRPVINNAKISTDLMQDFLDITSRLKKYELIEANPVLLNDNEVKKTLEVEYIDGTRQFFEDNTGAMSYTLSAVYNWFSYSISNVYEQIAERENYNNYYYDPFGW